VSGNKFPIINSCFAYGTLGKYTYDTSLNGNTWGSLTVSELSSNNNKLVQLDISKNYLQFNVSGIYQITTTLQFTTNLQPKQQIFTAFAFSYSTEANKNLPGTPPAPTPASLTTSINNISGPITLYEPTFAFGSKPYFITGSMSGGELSSSLTSSSFGGNVCMIPNTTPTTTLTIYPPFFIIGSANNTITASNVNTINSMYYIPAGTKIYFNIANTSTTSDAVKASVILNATGNFTVKLLNYMVPSRVISPTNVSVSTFQYSNGYYYYTFFPTSTTSSGTVTIETSAIVTMNYLLVGGGGGGGGGGYNTTAGNIEYDRDKNGNFMYYTFVNDVYSGGGGGGGQVLNSTVSGSSFNITIGMGGAAGSSGSSVSSGSNGGNTSLTVVGSTTLTALGGGGGSNTSAGGTGGAAGGKGLYLNRNTITNYIVGQVATNGTNGSTVNLPVGLTYNIGSGGGGGGSTSTITTDLTFGGLAGTNTGGICNGNNPNRTGQSSVITNYGAGGGGGGFYMSRGTLPQNNPNAVTGVTSYAGGSGSPGFAVLYWKA
jgi:hypothetical protein